jgi:hypothetical protein
MAYVALVRQLFNHFPRTSVERGMWTCQPCRSRWHIAAAQSGIDAMDRRRERGDYRNRKDRCEDRQSHMRMPPVAPVGIVVHGQYPLELESTQPLGAGSSAVPVVSDLVPPPSRAARIAEFTAG